MVNDDDEGFELSLLFFNFKISQIAFTLIPFARSTTTTGINQQPDQDLRSTIATLATRRCYDKATVKILQLRGPRLIDGSSTALLQIPCG
jgi:hypothetical protein